MISPPKIELLPEHLIDQIKAGEVIERPGNLIKEILENSLDAGATRLELTLKNNGLDLINLKDNGHGIKSTQLALAFSRHATSKISRFEDLYRLHSFGFRGEALASICAISKIQCVSFNQEEPEGFELRMEGGLTSYTGTRLKNPGQQGLELNIQDLFFNTPVRLKFIQSQQAEKNFLKKVIFSFILAHPQVEFILKFDEEEKEIYPARENLSQRLLDLMPKAANQIQHVQRGYEDVELELFLIPGNLRAPVKLQYAFINERFVLDKQLLRVLSGALQSVFGHDDFNTILFVRLPSEHMDVNVHPNKTVIKMFETSKVISLITGTIRELGNSQRPLAGQGTASHPATAQPTFTELQDGQPELLQERQEYNMEGLFSPHTLSDSHADQVWVGKYLLRQAVGRWEVIHPGRLLQHYVTERMRIPPSLSIPLLVSEPFKFSSDQLPRMKELLEVGLELEKLSPDTIVLRSIPDWMNGFPLKEVVSALLRNESLEKININPAEWSQSTWDDLLNAFTPSEKHQLRITLDLQSLLDERF